MNVHKILEPKELFCRSLTIGMDKVLQAFFWTSKTGNVIVSMVVVVLLANFSVSLKYTVVFIHTRFFLAAGRCQLT